MKDWSIEKMYDKYSFKDFGPRVICIEGYDGSGKSTLANNLDLEYDVLLLGEVGTIERRDSRGIKIKKIHFPHSVPMINILKGKTPIDPINTDPILMALAFVYDRRVYIPQLLNDLSNNDVIIFDRSWISTILYQAPKLINNFKLNALKNKKTLARYDKDYVALKGLYSINDNHPLYTKKDPSYVTIRNDIYNGKYNASTINIELFKKFLHYMTILDRLFIDTILSHNGKIYTIYCRCDNQEFKTNEDKDLYDNLEFNLTLKSYEDLILSNLCNINKTSKSKDNMDGFEINHVMEMMRNGMFRQESELVTEAFLNAAHSLYSN